MKNTIYTHTGDKGTTGLIGGTRISKSDKQLEAYGTVSELDANSGPLYTCLAAEHDKRFLLFIQHKLFQVCRCLATDYSKVKPEKVREITSGNVKSIEDEIDAINKQLPS